MLHLILFAAAASALPITTTGSSSPDSSPQNLTEQIRSALVHIAPRATCELGADGMPPGDCSHVNSVLRAAFALFCVFAFLVLIHVWQATKYNKIHAVFGTYVADDSDEMGAKVPYIMLEEPESP